MVKTCFYTVFGENIVFGKNMEIFILTKKIILLQTFLYNDTPFGTIFDQQYFCKNVFFLVNNMFYFKHISLYVFFGENTFFCFYLKKKENAFY